MLTTDNSREHAAAADGAARSQAAIEGRLPLCFVVDEDPNVRHFLSLILIGRGMTTELFADIEAFRNAVAHANPDLVFLNVGLDSSEAIKSLEALGKSGHFGFVQLISDRGMAVLDHVKKVGEQFHLNMLPCLKKPFDTKAVADILYFIKLGDAPAIAARIGLDEALANGWIEFWYQPKIDLRLKQLVGVETFARARHPQYGIVPPAAFLPGATDADLVALAERALTNAIKSSLNIAKMGIALTLSLNMSLKELVTLPIGDIVRAHVPQPRKWKGLIIELTEQQIINDLELARDITDKLEALNIKLAIDDFGRGYSSLMRLKQFPFAELKISRAFVEDCAVHSTRAPICRTVIDLAHNFGSKAVAIGIEKARDLAALTAMGCDYGQGFLLGQPMPEERLLSLLKLRASRPRPAPSR